MADRRNGWDFQLSHAVLQYKRSVNASTEVVSNGVNIGHLPRLPATVFERRTFDGHQGRDQDQIFYNGLVRSGQRRAHVLVCEQRAIGTTWKTLY